MYRAILLQLYVYLSQNTAESLIYYGCVITFGRKENTNCWSCLGGGYGDGAESIYGAEASQSR